MSDFRTVILKHSTIPGKGPTSDDLEQGEVAVNLADFKIFTKDLNGVVKDLTVSPDRLIEESIMLSGKIDLRVSISDIVNNLTTDATNRPLSAEQGRVLKGHIDTINAVLQSDDNTLDELQEVVNFIKLNRAELDSLSVNSIAGLEARLSSLQASNVSTNTALNTHKTSADHDGRYVKPADYATSTKGGTVKMRLDGTTLYITNAGSDA